MAVSGINSTGGPMDWFNQLPKISRTYAASLIATAACISWGIGGVMYLLLDWRAVRGLQVWRLLTHVFVADKLGFKLLFQCIWVLQYGSTLESVTYAMHPENYLFMLFFGACCLSAISFVMGPLLSLAHITYTGSAMVMMLLYVWSKEFPEQDIKLYGIVKIKGFWLPFAFMAITMLMGQPPTQLMTDILGVLVGHTWYFFTMLLPRGTGKTYIPTPNFVKWAAMKMELIQSGPVSAAAPQSRRATATMPAARTVATAGSGSGTSGSGGFQAFRGAGRRLGS